MANLFADSLSVLSVGSDGSLNTVETVDAGGRFTYVVNTDSINVSVFTVEAGGGLSLVGTEASGLSPQFVVTTP